MIITRYYADTGFSVGDSNSASKFILFRELTASIPSYIYKCMHSYGEDYIGAKKGITDRASILLIKESIDDYLEDVQYRSIRRLDSSTYKELRKYSSYELVTMLDKLNSISIALRVDQIIDTYKLNTK